MLKLFIGNKNYSSWSMRPWVLLTQAGIPFQEVMLRFDSFEADTTFKRAVLAVNPAGKVPVLVDAAAAPEIVVWDTLAIAEYLAERSPGKQLWPQDTRARARARSVCAEMHSGFGALRGNCPMNVEASLPEVGALLWRDKPAVRAEVSRLVQMWSELLDTHGGPMLFGAFSVADAYFAPVCMRLTTYALPVPPAISAYVQRVCALSGVKAWIVGALAERDFLDFEEPYRLKR
jgi:glutathione S-transferase